MASIHVVLFEEARQQAQALDDYLQRTKKLKGPLHGVPVSFKDICKPHHFLEMIDLKMR